MAGLTLTHGDQQVLLRPQLGGAVERFTWRDIDLLRPAGPDAGVRHMGIFPLLPYANRIGNGQLPGHPPLAQNLPPEPHSLHGFGWQRPWQIDISSERQARLTLAHVADADWPFDCSGTFDVLLAAGGLHLRLGVRHDGPGSMPAGLGFHPFFPTDSATLLDAHWSGMWETGPDHLPRQHIAAVPAAGMALADWHIDHCFTAWDGVARLHYRTHIVTISADCPFLHCFKPADGRPFIALEPVSHMPNAHQMAPRQLRQLGHGEQFCITMHIQPQARPA